MSQRALADVPLPEADKAVEATAVDRRVVLNVEHRGDVPCADHAAGVRCGATSHWSYTMDGREIAPDDLGEHLAAVARDASEPGVAGVRGLSTVTLTIRADRGAPYGLVRDALEACAGAGIHRTEVAAARPAER
jgi:biopolymer transport protein ExbD